MNTLVNKTILVVDDEEDLLPVLEGQLQTLGMKVLKAANADKALLLQQSYPGVIDFLLTDIIMPGTDGIKLAEILSRNAPQMGIVYMTGKTEGWQSLTPFEKEMALVNKPLRPETLSQALQCALDQVQDMES